MHASSSMKPCIYRGKIDGNNCRCTNVKDLMHGGTVPVELCGYCPFAREPDFFAQTERLQVTQYHRGEYTPLSQQKLGRPPFVIACSGLSVCDGGLELPRGMWRVEVEVQSRLNHHLLQCAP